MGMKGLACIWFRTRTDNAARIKLFCGFDYGFGHILGVVKVKG
jgi:hypothetical protein